MNYRELEEGVTRLESVDAARVVVEGDRITEVHVIASADKSAKQVVRDVQSLAMARFGAALDRRIISVVQMSNDRAKLPTEQRPQLIRVHEDPDGARTTLKVTLRWQDVEHTGEATGPAVSSTRLRLIGEAALNAVEQTYDTAPPIALDTIEVATLGQRRVVVVVVVTAEDGAEKLAVGSALSHGDDGDAAVRAILDALNRQLATLDD